MNEPSPEKSTNERTHSIPNGNSTQHVGAKKDSATIPVTVEMESNVECIYNESSSDNDAHSKHMRHEDDVENVRQILAHHPCTPRPDPLPYHETKPVHSPHRNGDHHSKRSGTVTTKQKLKCKKSKQFTKSSLKPITTPRPESVGIDSTDDEEDDESESNLLVPDDDADIAALDDYTLKKKAKWQERQKGPSYHAYTTHDAHDADEEAEHKKETPSHKEAKKSNSG